MRWRKPARCRLSACIPPAAASFSIGKAMNKNLTINMGNCHHRKYIPLLIELVRTGALAEHGTPALDLMPIEAACTVPSLEVSLMMSCGPLPALKAAALGWF